MFLKRLFRKSENPETPSQTDRPIKMPAGHPGNLKYADAAKCPFMNKKQETEDDEPRGGCPFMNAKDNQKNPGLQLFDSAYDYYMVSKFKYYLSKAKLDFSFLYGKHRKNKAREVFDKYPLYLKHTLFYASEDLVKIRSFECCSRFMAYDELRERGNKEFHAGNYNLALDYYEKALSLFKWLEHREPVEEYPMVSVDNICSKQDLEVSESDTSKSKIELNLEGQEYVERLLKKGPPKKYYVDEFRKKYKYFFVYYCDYNVILKDGEEMSEVPDIDMRKSLMVQIYLNMAAAYMKLHHFSLAIQCCNDASSLTDRVSQILFRRAQAIVLNKASTVTDLQEAHQLIQQAIQNKQNYKIFTNVNKNILKMLNLQDVDEAYVKLYQLITYRIAATEISTKYHRDRVIHRMYDIHRFEQEILASGRTPTYRQQEHSAFDTTEYKIICRMKDKYLRVIDFYTEGQKPEYVSAAKDQLQEVLRVIHDMQLINSIKLEDFPEYCIVGDRESQKVKNRLEKVKSEHSDAMYNQGKYNFEVLEWAIKEIVDEYHKKKEYLKETQKQEAAKNAGTKEAVKPNPQKFVWLLLILPLLTILAHRLLF